ncbi:NYN domain-containing protein [Roseococcus pinisoli]|uniref:NYN domain-containing protein n=1 Tax=Roseococcus pinisoli TaxID=2835040 RepID=A0ABS5QFR5_9PROT|nr:NYN domain-containing protein [Roseococcus pinisoli]MBS7812547.1 NYN domain-containing protein [Roseococcus pinisoli]
MPPMPELRSAIFLDFDNLVSGLREGAGSEAALRFAQQPELWLERLLADRPRRALIRRCYMNPAGMLDHDGSRFRYADFRWAFMASGFDVVDCPKLTRLKNAADVRIALDAMEAMLSPTHLDEFTLLSTDSDFVPLLLRLRAADRRTRLVAHPEVGRIVRSAADEVIGLDVLAGWLGWQASPEPGEAFGETTATDLLGVVRDIMMEAQDPVHVPHLGQMVRDRTGWTLRGSDFAGHGTLDALLKAAGGFIRQDGPGGGHVLRPEWALQPPEA